jgi:hypothetical protein
MVTQKAIEIVTVLENWQPWMFYSSIGFSLLFSAAAVPSRLLLG